MATPGEGQGGWDNLRFRTRDRLARTPEEAAESRFRIGMAVFLAVVLLYPWYAYWVQTRLLAFEVSRAMQDVTKAFEQGAAAARRGASAAQQPQTQPQARTQRRTAPRYDASVRTMGAVRTRNGPMVIVDLAGRSLEDARLPICVQAAEWLGEPVQGQVLRVQRYRAHQPSISAGVVRC